MRNAFKTWLPAVAWSLLTVAAAGDALSSAHTNGLLDWLLQHLFSFLGPRSAGFANALLRKAGHFLNYAILSWLWFRAFRYWELRASSRAWALRWALRAFALTALTALADETLQRLVPSRTGSAMDVLLDCAGALFAQLLLLRVWLARRPKPEAHRGTAQR